MRLGTPPMGSDVSYATSGDVDIAYRVLGDGPRDLVLIPGPPCHAELFWELSINQYLLRSRDRRSAASRCIPARESRRRCGPQAVLVSGTVRDLVAGSGIRFDGRGSHVLKGVPSEWGLFAVRSA